MVTTSNVPALRSSKPLKRGNAARLFGYDIFISFALGTPPRGTQSYASDLARRLRERDFTVFFSEDEAPPREKLDGAPFRSTLPVAVPTFSVSPLPRSTKHLIRSTLELRPVLRIPAEAPGKIATKTDRDRMVTRYGSLDGRRGDRWRGVLNILSPTLNGGFMAISQKDVFFSSGLQYYIGGRSAVRAGLNPVAGNLLHHAIEMCLKGGLSKTLEELKKLGHNLPKIWKEFKKQIKDPAVDQFDTVINQLHRFEEIRYPDSVLALGMTSRVSFGPPSPAVADARTDPGGREPTYELWLGEIDELLIKICAASSVDPKYFLSGNIETDKKHSQMNSILTRGKRVVAEALVPRDIMRRYLHIDTADLARAREIQMTGSFMAGSASNGAHAANALAALFISTGQDVANIAECHASFS